MNVIKSFDNYFTNKDFKHGLNLKTKFNQQLQNFLFNFVYF